MMRMSSKCIRHYPRCTICHTSLMISFPSKIVQGMPWFKPQYLLHEADLTHTVSERLRAQSAAEGAKATGISNT